MVRKPAPLNPSTKESEQQPQANPDTCLFNLLLLLLEWCLAMDGGHLMEILSQWAYLCAPSTKHMFVLWL